MTFFVEIAWSSNDYFFPLQFRTYTSEDGLGDNQATFVTEDTNGFIWIATRSGIFRFDGVIFQHFSHLPTSDSSAEDSRVNVLLVDSKNNIWVGTPRNVSVLFQGSSEFISLTSNDKENTQNMSSVTAIFEDSQGNIWIGGTSGIYRYQNDTKQLKKISLQSESTYTIDDINFITETPSAEIWIGTYSGIYVLDNHKLKFSQIEFNKQAQKVLTTSGVNAIEWVDNNKAIVSTGTALYEIQLTSRTAAPIVINSGKNLLDKLTIFGIKKSLSGIIWIATSNQGLLFYNPENYTVKRQKNDPFVENTLASDSILQVFRDSSGFMWIIPSWGGVQVWLPITEKFRKLSHHLVDDNSLPASRVWALTKGIESDLWVGTENGLAHWHIPSNVITRYLHDSANKQTPLPGAVYSLHLQNNRFLWIGSAFGLTRLDILSKNILRFVNDEYNEESIGYGSVLGITELDAARLLIATEFDGLNIFDTETFRSRNLDITSTEKVSPLFNQIYGLQPSKFGGQWIMTEGGLIYYEPKSGTKYFIEEGLLNRGGLSHRRVGAIHEAKNGSVWLGTLGGGINYSDNIFSEKRKFEYFEKLDELKQASIKSILADDSGILWLGTRKGVLRFDKNRKEVSHFNRYFGLQYNELSPLAAVISNQGDFYFGGVNGLTFFSPEDIHNDSKKPKIFITDIQKNNKSILNKNSLWAPKAIQLNHETVILSLHYTLLDYAAPENTQYQFKMKGKGFNNKWVNFGKRREVTFTNLAHGEYTFQVQGTNHLGTPTESIAQLKIQMIPPWWKRWWAYVLYFSVIGIVLIILVEERLKKLRAERREAYAIREREDTLKQVLWGSGDEMWDWNVPQNKIRRNHPLKFVELHNDTINIEDWLSCIFKRERPEIENQLQEHILGNTAFFEAIYRVTNAKKEEFWILSRAKAVKRNREGKALRIVGTHKDISSIKSTEDKFRLIAKAFENTSDGVSVTDTRFINVAVNKAFCEITGYTMDEVVGKPFFFTGLNTNELQSMMEVLTALKTRGSWYGELIEKRKNGELFYIDLNIDAVRDSDGEVTHYVSVFSDVTFKKKAEEDLIRLANYDSLTRLPNRNLLKDRLEQAIILARHQQRQFSLLFLDIDDFKTVNDSLGHPAGDKMLKEVALRLVSCVKETDTVARLGGDEFIVLYESMENHKDLLDCCAKILKEFRRSISLGDEHATVSTSIGIGLYPDDGEDVDTLIKHADIAMYHAKREGKNNYQFFTEEMNQLASERLTIENSIRSAISNNQFKLYYQAKVNTKTLKLSGFEALVRWKDPEQGYVLPLNFITVAEESGLIIDLGDWTLNEACKQIKIWEPLNKDIKIAVNLSGKQFQDKNLIDKVADIINRHKVNPRNLELEITESILMTNTDYTMRILSAFRAMGITLSLDDFGTGYSSLKYLKEFPVDKLKVDQSFVAGVPHNQENANIVSLIISLAHQFHLDVVVEGIESVEQLDFVSNVKGDEVQGYLFSQPVNGDEATNLVKQQVFKLPLLK